MHTPTSDTPAILVVMTGGTICCVTDEHGKRYSDAATIDIVDRFQRGPSPFAGHTVCFETILPLDILSENMTIERWNILLAALRGIAWERYRGVIILHGTDTLAYTASLLALALSGAPVPVCMVSAQLPLADPATNGHANFQAAVELIMNGIAPNVYAVYRNHDAMLVHLGAHLRQCADFSDEFFSADAMRVPDDDSARLKGTPFQTAALFERELSLTPCVLSITPYVGLSYETVCLDGIAAVVHGTYHSETVCADGDDAPPPSSVLWLLERCRARDIAVMLTPCRADAYAYTSTGNALSHGAIAVGSMTKETVFVKALIGCALGYRGDRLIAFMNTPINGEDIF